jgi:putative ABC transport system permease protein
VLLEGPLFLIRVIGLLAFSLGGLALLLAMAGLFGILTHVVERRTREIGIRLAIGALERQVLTQFLVEAVVLSGFGGIIGIVLGLGLAALATNALAVPFLLNPGIVLLAFTFSALVGVVFGYFPARRAAHLDPIEALRHE